MIEKGTLKHIKSGQAQRQKRFYIVIVCLILSILVVSILSLILGNTNYTINEIMDVFNGTAKKDVTFAVKTLRLPRIIGGILTGIAFGAAGASFQTMLHNPLASPDVIGVTSGSSLVAVFCILILQISGPAVSFLSVIGGLVTALLVFLLSKGGKFSGGKLILIGIGVRAMFDAAISYFLLKASQNDVPAAMRWLSGSLNGVQFNQMLPLIIVVIVMLPVLLLFQKQLRILELGDEKATTLGLSADKVRLIFILCSVCLLSFACALTGPIAFVAFLSGPIAVRLVKSSSQSILPAALMGALLTITADLLGRVAFDTKFPVGVITGLLGAPYLIFLLIRMNKVGGAS